MDSIRVHRGDHPRRGRGAWLAAGGAAVAMLSGAGAVALASSTTTVSPAVVQVSPSPLRASLESTRAAGTLRPTTRGAGDPSGAVGTGSGTETLAVGVLPGPFVGPPARVTVPLLTHGGGDGAEGVGGRLRVVDARGSLLGWRVSVVVTACDDAAGRAASFGAARVVPEAPTVLDGDPVGLTVGRPRRAVVGEDVLVLSAAAGHGGGTFEAKVAIAVSGHHGHSRPTSCLLGVTAQPASS